MASPDTVWQAAADASRRIGRAVEFHASIGSTNDRARAALSTPESDGLAVVADLQTAGRGRQGRSWLSPAGRNLAVSVGFRPRLSAERAGLLGLAAAVAARDACQSAVPPAHLAIRWPNDIVTVDGRKVAGLLVETALAGERVSEAVVGIGINVNWRRSEMPPELAERATSLADLAGRDLDRVALLRELLRRMDEEVGALESGGSPVDAFRAASALDGRWVTVDLGGRRANGRVVGIADDGAMLLDRGGTVDALSIGEVVAVRDAPAEVVA
jgi:BirA family transcriptional regulator, biotin operon repressor / biotin---[acetyl-CoA-carboxylase] ligase